MSFISTKCPFTGLNAEVFADISTAIHHYKCLSWGGRFAIDFNAYTEIQNMLKENSNRQGLMNCAKKSLEVQKEGSGLTAFWTCRANAENARQNLKATQFLCILEDVVETPTDHSQKPLELLKRYALKLSSKGMREDTGLTDEDLVLIGLVDYKEFELVSLFLRNNVKWIEPGDRYHSMSPKTPLQIHYRITVEGWEVLSKAHAPFHSNKVFIAAQFIWPENDDVREQAMATIKKVCKELGYDASLVSQNITDNISDQIITEIKKSRFVIAEFTYNNRGVYFESGFARGLNIPVFHLVHEDFINGEGGDATGRRIHFDIQQVMYRKWKTPRDLESTLKYWIEAKMGRYIGFKIA